MPEVKEAMIRAGYRTPDENPFACRNCPSVTRKTDPSMSGCFVHSARFYCGRRYIWNREADRVAHNLLDWAIRDYRREGETNSDVLRRCNDCIAMCRVIAEEGAGNAS